MKILKLARPVSTRARIGSLVIGMTFTILAVGSWSCAAAQNVTPRPVARLIGGMPNNSRPRRIKSSEETRLSTSGNLAGAPSLAEATATERRVFEVTNEVRAKDGLAPLMWDPELCRLARTHSRDMSRLGFFSHETPEGLRLRDRVQAAGIRYQVVAENIAYNQGYDDPGAFAVERWTISSAHRANLLSTEFRGSAIGSFVAPDGTVFLTQLFILR